MPTLQETHFAVVTDNADPEKRGRLKVTSQTLTGAGLEMPDWVEPDGPLYTSKGGGAALFLPRVGSTVELVVAVHDTDLDEYKGERFLQNPGSRWRPAAPTDGTGAVPLPADLQTNYPERRGVVTPAGHELIFDDASGELIVKSKAGSTIVLKANGDVEIKSPVLIGIGATEPMVLGNALKTWLDSHTHPTGVGPSGPPTTPLPPTALSQEGNKIK